MNAAFKPDETFRNDFTFRNSPEAIRRFPLPFHEDEYMYSVNIEPHLPGPRGSVTEFAFDVFYPHPPLTFSPSAHITHTHTHTLLSHRP